MKYDVVLSEDAEAHLVGIFEHIADQSSLAIARQYVDDITAFCAKLEDFPERGTLRGDLGPSMRVIGFRRRVAIAFEVIGGEVLIAGIYYGGVDYSSSLRRK